MARKKHVDTSPAKPVESKYPRVIEAFGDPAVFISRPNSSPSIFNGGLQVERYTIRIEKVDEPEDVIVARLKKLWRETARNIHHWHPVRAYLMATFGWDHGRTLREFPSDEQGVDHVQRSR